MVSNNTILTTGFAQLPKGTTQYEKYQSLAVVLVINVETEVIEDVEFTFIADLTNYYLTSLVRGYDLKQGINPLIEILRSRVLIPSQGAVIQSIKSAWDRYKESKTLAYAL
ncbi:DUF3870 domain-containing protein [Niallia endozanthoxylica]|uniref:DUF3870 domain-containing protein n=1 Tax=Niallia endozanthoxylica TaxID=2036016 RepID=A0A5J5HYJ2_9BACI|nr:DUF3870 domain-containing protein [Niallia endozanthoxylica]KAA9027050.1 DUF3870 domain-containing protein [Niallia endozanthoxylica]